MHIDKYLQNIHINRCGKQDPANRTATCFRPAHKSLLRYGSRLDQFNGHEAIMTIKLQPKILVVDDHKELRQAVVLILERNGFEVDTVDNATIALKLAQSGNYDFVLVDYQMPVHDGLWFMKRLREPRHTKILMMTAQNNMYISLAMIQAGCDGYIIKPFNEDDLLRHLQFYAQSDRFSATHQPTKNHAPTLSRH